MPGTARQIKQSFIINQSINEKFSEGVIRIRGAHGQLIIVINCMRLEALVNGVSGMHGEFRFQRQDQFVVTEPEGKANEHTHGEKLPTTARYRLAVIGGVRRFGFFGHA